MVTDRPTQLSGLGHYHCISRSHQLCCVLAADSGTGGRLGPEAEERKTRKGRWLSLPLPVRGTQSLHSESTSPGSPGVPAARDSGRWKENLEYLVDSDHL